MAPPRVICCSIWPETPAVKFGCRNRSGVEQGDLCLALAPDEPPGQRDQRHGPDRHEQADELAALLPDQDPEHDAAHADDGQDRADDVDLAGAGVGDVADQPDLAQDDGDDDDLSANPTRQDR